VAGRRNLPRQIFFRQDGFIAVLLNEPALMIVIVEISRSPHDGFQLIQTSMAGHLKPRKFADWMLDG
jgi:hypothetical protein